jgi:hypothetical protein
MRGLKNAPYFYAIVLSEPNEFIKMRDKQEGDKKLCVSLWLQIEKEYTKLIVSNIVKLFKIIQASRN